MARPINPQAARRSHDDAEVEILSRAGYWISWSRLGDASITNVLDAFRIDNVYGFPAGRFQWARPEDNEQFTPDETPQVEQHVNPVQVDDQEFQIEIDDQSPEPEQQQQPQQEQPQDTPSPMPPSPLEEMVRIIAAQVASELDTNVASNVLDAVDARLQDFKPVTTDVQHRPQVTVQVEIRRPDRPIEQRDGLFHQEFPTLLELVGAGQHVYLPGPPGSGKSHAGKQVADAIGYKYVDISLSNDMPESRLWGGRTADGGFIETPIIDAIRHAVENIGGGSVILLDEMDAARTGLITSLNSTLANGRITLPNGDVLEWGDNLVFIGAANTYGTGPTAEFPGRNKLDAASLNRFAYLPWDTDEGMEQAVIDQYLDSHTAYAWGDAWRTLRSNVKSYGLKVFVTMRGARNGARLLSVGMDMTKVMDLVIGNSVPADQWAKVNPL
jgi:hypothetical protein